MKDMIWDDNLEFNCGTCAIHLMCCEGSQTKKILFGSCKGLKGSYRFKEEEPVKIQTEYEHNLERYKLLFGSGLSHHYDETVKLAGWIANNKPEKWETCSKINTSKDDIVRHKETKNSRIVEAVGIDCHHFFIFDLNSNNSMSGLMGNYEINVYKE